MTSIKRPERGYTLIVALIAIAFVSSLSITFVEYAQWQTQLSNTESSLHRMNQARRVARHRSRKFLKNQIQDSPVISTKEIEWNLPPDIKMKTKIESLNAKVNLNRFREANATETFRKMVDNLLEELNYPDRSMQELARWISSEEELRGLGPGRYGGYRYSAPHRKILHMDEIKLISGFKEIGLNKDFRELFTVYGSGAINPLHFSPRQWKLMSNALPQMIDKLPARALRSKSSLKDFLSRESVWNRVAGNLPFLTRKDDSFLIKTRIEDNKVVERITLIYIYNESDKALQMETQFSRLQLES